VNMFQSVELNPWIPKAINFDAGVTIVTELLFADN